MIPKFLDSYQWTSISGVMTGLWILVLVVVIAAFSFLIGKGAVQSLVYTRALPGRALKVRFFFYAISVIALLGIGYVFGSLVATAINVLDYFYPRWLL